MIPDFKTYIGESVWNDIRRRGNGTDVKKEDKLIIGFGISEMYDYLKDSYKDKVYWIDGDKKGCIDDGSIGMDPVEGISMYFDYGEDDKLTEIVMFYTTKSFSEDPKEYPDFFKKLSNAFNVSIYNNKPEFSKQWTIKPKSGELTNKTIIEVIEFFLNTEINESVWGDIRRRGNGTDVKKEDDVDHLDREQFCEYLKDIYDVHPSAGVYNINEYKLDDNIIVPICFKDASYNPNSVLRIEIEYNTPETIISISANIIRHYLDILDKLENTFMVIDVAGDRERGRHVNIYPKDKDKHVTNSFFITVIDFILDNIDEPREKIITKK